MSNIKMRDTTAHADTGSLRKGEVYAVSDELATHLVSRGLAVKTTASTTAEREAELAEGDLEPSIEEQAAEAGTKPGDQSTDSIRSPQPVNPPTPVRHPR